MSLKRNEKPSSTKLAEKEAQVKELASKLNKNGFVVRREQLKQGMGWRTLSGACMVEGSKYIFVDRKLPLEEQLAFLTSCAREAGLEA